MSFCWMCDIQRTFAIFPVTIDTLIMFLTRTTFVMKLILILRMVEKCLYPGKNERKKEFLLPSKLSSHSLCSVDRFQILIIYNLWKCITLGFCLKILPLIVFEMEINRIFHIDLIVNPACYAFSIHHQTIYDLLQ